MGERLNNFKTYVTVTRRDEILLALGLTAGVAITVVAVRKTPMGLCCISQEQAKLMLKDPDLVVKFDSYSGTNLLADLFFNGKVMLHIHPKEM